ncbi:hypothetical protein J6590_027738 [Homalodisca vitripennis]|nr:hypothetical protein J6590_027738 [Homalodisca vitripennis]
MFHNFNSPFLFVRARESTPVSSPTAYVAFSDPRHTQRDIGVSFFTYCIDYFISYFNSIL